jgi:hypothetical protein
VDLKGITVERTREFGGAWLGLELLRRLGLEEFVKQMIPGGREEVSWAAMAMVLVLGRLCDPSSELRLAEKICESNAMVELLGIPDEKEGQ